MNRQYNNALSLERLATTSTPQGSSITSVREGVPQQDDLLVIPGA